MLLLRMEKLKNSLVSSSNMSSLRVSLVIPRGENGKFILARRAVDKHPFPNTWVCGVGGKADGNETFEEAALREMFEEVGFSSPISKMGEFHYDNEFKADFVVFTTEKSLDVSSFKPDPAEIQFLKEFTIDEIKSMISVNPNDFAPTFRVALEEFVKNLD